MFHLQSAEHYVAWSLDYRSLCIVASLLLWLFTGDEFGLVIVAIIVVRVVVVVVVVVVVTAAGARSITFINNDKMI